MIGNIYYRALFGTHWPGNKFYLSYGKFKFMECEHIEEYVNFFLARSIFLVQNVQQDIMLFMASYPFQNNYVVIVS